MLSIIERVLTSGLTQHDTAVLEFGSKALIRLDRAAQDVEAENRQLLCKVWSYVASPLHTYILKVSDTGYYTLAVP